jgi:UPF0755 protein
MFKSKIIVTLLLAFLAIIAIAGYKFYNRIYFPNLYLLESRVSYIYIPTGASFETVLKSLNENATLGDADSFIWLAKKMEYDKNIRPGKYQIHDKMSNKELVTLLKSGRQIPVRVVFNNVRVKAQLVSIVSGQIEADSVSLMKALNDKALLAKYGITPANSISLFITNTYEFYWNTSAEGFIERMAREHNKFWNETRLDKAKKLNLTPAEISVLASIVEQETRKNDEKPVVAGVYLNRIRRNWKLEADPTLVFAAGDFTIKRVLNIHKEIDSPYNTYKYAGLPPGPICIPSIVSIDAVLNHKKHEYMFFCAREDFSGYHSFAKTYQEHLINANRFRKELNRRKIRS